MSLDTTSPSRQRYILILLLFFHTVNTYMDRACISAARDSIIRDLGFTDQMMGFVFGIFALGYALFQIPAGWVADSYGPRRALTGIVTLWSAFTMLTGAAWNTVSMLIIRFLFGVGEAGAFPGATRAFYRWVPAAERGMAQGIFHSGARLGAAFSLFLMPVLIRWVGWRWSFIINGLIGIVWALIWWYWFRDTPAEHKRVNPAELQYIKEGLTEDDRAAANTLPLGQVLTSANMLLAMCQYAASNVTFFISFSWLLPYLVDTWGAGAEIYAPIPLVIGMFAQWTSGGLIMRLHRRGFRISSRRIPAMIGFLLGAGGLLLATQVDDILPFICCFSIAVFGVEMTISPSWSFCMDIGGDKSGAVSGAMNMLGNLGAAFSAILFPYFVAHVTVPWFAETTGNADSFFLFAAVVNVFGAGAWIFMNPDRFDMTPLPAARVRLRVILLIGGIVLLTIGSYLYKEFFRG